MCTAQNIVSAYGDKLCVESINRKEEQNINVL